MRALAAATVQATTQVSSATAVATPAGNATPISTKVPPPEVSQAIAAATADAWMIVDAVHRLRELVQQTPKLKQKEPAIQLLLRETKTIEELRHYVQHLRSGIDDSVLRKLPAWGTLSWGEFDAERNAICHILFPGTAYPEMKGTGVVLDTQEHVFLQGLALAAGKHEVDLEAVMKRLTVFAAWYCEWFNNTYNSEPRNSADIHAKIIFYRSKEGYSDVGVPAAAE
jgi:hypothetical protein